MNWKNEILVGTLFSIEAKDFFMANRTMILTQIIILYIGCFFAGLYFGFLIALITLTVGKLLLMVELWGLGLKDIFRRYY